MHLLNTKVPFSIDYDPSRLFVIKFGEEGGGGGGGGVFPLTAFPSRRHTAQAVERDVNYNKPIKKYFEKKYSLAVSPNRSSRKDKHVKNRASLIQIEAALKSAILLLCSCLSFLKKKRGNLLFCKYSNMKYHYKSPMLVKFVDCL